MAENIPTLDQLNIKPTRYDAGLDHALPSLDKGIGSLELDIRQGRGQEVSTVGVVGGVERAIKFLGAGIGLGQVGDEVIAYEKALDRLDPHDSLMQDLFKRELEGKSAEVQAEFLSAGMGSVKKVVEGLMRVRAQAPELNGKVVMDGIKKLGVDFASATQEDIEVTQEFFEGMEQARTEMMKRLGKMWDAKETMDSVNKVREIVEIGHESSRDEQYELQMESGVVRQIQSVARRLLPGGLKRAGNVFRRAGKAANLEVDTRLADLRSQTLRSGDEVLDIRMWKAGIISREELGKVDTTSILEKGEVKLNEEEATALRDNQELSKHTRAVKDNKNGKREFRRASQTRQYEFFAKHYGRMVQATEADFVQAKENWLQFDVSNAGKWDEKGIVLQVNSAVKGLGEKVNANLGTVAEAISIPVPRWLKEGGTYLASIGAEGALTMVKAPGGALEFAIDHTESILAGDALERLTSTMLAREATLDQLKSVAAAGYDGDDGKVDFQALQAAMAVRGSEAVILRSAAYAARVAETINMAHPDEVSVKGVVEAGLAVPRAVIDSVTGGLFGGEIVEEVFEDLKVRATLLDGKAVLTKHAGKIEITGRTSLNESDEIMGWAEDIGIPDEYVATADMNRLIKSGLAMRAVEWGRKQIGEEGELLGIGKLLKLKDSEVWQVLAGGSKRQSVQQVIAKVGESYKRSVIAAQGLSEQVSTMGSERSNADRDCLVETATAITLKDAKELLVESELQQIKKRSQLDKMWVKVNKLGAQAALVTAVAVGLSGSEEIVDKWNNGAHVWTGETSDHLLKVKAVFNDIMKLAQSADMKGTAEGARSDLKWAEIWNNLAKTNEGAAIAVGANFLKIKLGALITAAAAPVLAAVPAGFEVLRAKVKSKFMAPTGEIK